jgi:hypothetical protein
MLRTLGALPMMMILSTGNCGGGGTTADPSTESATEAIDTTDVVQSESAVFVASTDGLNPSMGTDALAGAASDRAKAFWQPAGCLTATARAAEVTYTLNDCTGPFGLVHVTGSVVVDYSLATDGIHAHAVANGLSVNGADMNIDAQAVYSISGTTKRLQVATTGTGTGPRGSAIARTGSYTVTWDPTTSCVGLDGQWQTTIAGLQWSTQISGLDKCGSHCPAAGGTVTHHGGLSNITVTVDFDGSANADWSTSTGRTGTVSLFCTP